MQINKDVRRQCKDLENLQKLKPESFLLFFIYFPVFVKDLPKHKHNDKENTLYVW